MPADATTSFESFDTVSTRLRVIASCDHCRSRKIKCVTQSGQAKCDACTRHKTECTYHARAKYYTDRERAVASKIGGSSGGVATLSGSLSGGSSIISFSPAPAPAAQPSRPTRTTKSPPPPLFEPTYPEYPTIALMPYYIELFFKHHASSFPFIGYENIVSSFLQSSLSSTLSNAIACLAARHAPEMAELAGVDSSTAPEYYANQTKSLLQRAIPTPSVDTLRTLILVSFHEHSAERRDGLAFYVRHAAHMAQTLHIYNDTSVANMSRSTEEYHQLLALRTVVTQLYEMVQRW